MSDKKLFLFDAYALIYRAYYAFIRAPRVNSKGVDTSAIFGFTNTLLDIIKRANPTHVAVVFDPPGLTFRDAIYPEYKANREATPESIRSAIPRIKEILEAMNITQLLVPGFEADDVMGTLASLASREGFTTYIVTPDKDLSQVVSQDIFIYKPKTSSNEVEIWGVEEVKRAFQVNTPSSVIDVLALWGDASDNIPGCPGIGEKRSKEIIEKYHTLESVYLNIEDFKGKQKENLLQYREQVELSKQLVTIQTNVPLDLEIETTKLAGMNLQQLFPLLEDLEFKTLVERLKGESKPTNTTPLQGQLFNFEPTEPDYPQNNLKTIDNVPHKYHLIDTTDEIIALAKELNLQRSFCFDTETTSLAVWDASLVGIALSWKAHEAYYVPIPANPEFAKERISLLKPLFENGQIQKIGQNIKFDAAILKRYGVEVNGPLFDTMIAHHLIQPGLRHNLDYLANIYLQYQPISINSLIGEKGKKQGSMRDVPLEKIKDYAAEDADVTIQLKAILEKELEEAGLTSFFNDTEMPLIKVLVEIENSGVKVDIPSLNEIGANFKQRLSRLEEEIIRLAGREFNINSPKQVGEILFKVLKIEDGASKTKSGQFVTNEEALQKLKQKHEIVPLILEQRGLKKLLSTYIESLPELIVKQTGRIHTSYSQATVVTGRLSSSNPNLQNIPINDEEGREIRRAFTTPGSDFLFVSADYSQVELRLMAHLSNDPHLVEAFKNGEDIHTATASRIFNVTRELVTPEMRRKAKTANFGIIYGISAFGLSERLNISRAEAKAIIDGYFANFPGVKEYMANCIAMARSKGYVETIYGRKRLLPDINSRNAVVRGMAERNAINAPIQGTAADIIKKAMVSIQAKIEQSGLTSKMILQVHDELNFEVTTSELDVMKEIIKTGMENACSLRVPLVVEIGAGKNWLEAH